MDQRIGTGQPLHAGIGAGVFEHAPFCFAALLDAGAVGSAQDAGNVNGAEGRPALAI
jgi:hypothetical protein